MFPQQPQQQFRTAGADVQIFYGSANNVFLNHSWSKPVGVSHIYMMCIGAGGNGDGTSGGGSGAVTVWYGSAQNIPNILNISIGTGGSTVRAKFTGTSSTNLVNANNASGITGGTAEAASQFTASGFYQSVAGQNGSASDIPTPSTTTFLSGGAASGAVIANYGYQTSSTNEPGSFRLQPIIVGSGGSGTTSNPVPGGIGCGGAAASPSGKGGPGMVLIASW